MVQQSVTFDAGANGGPINAANVPTGGTTVDITGSPTSEYSNTQAADGALSWHVNAATSTIARLRVTLGASSDRLAFRFYFRFVTTPTASGNVIAEIRDTSSGVVFNVVTDSARTLQVVPKTGGATALGQLALNTWYRIEGEAVRATASTGAWNLRAYELHSTSPTYSASSTTADLGTSNLNQVCFGKVSSSPAWEGYYDGLVVDGGATTPVGPAVTATSPAYPASVVSNPGAWSNQGGAGSLQAALADSNDATFIESPGVAAGETIVLASGPLAAGNVREFIRMRLAAGETTGSATVALMQGGTVIREFTTGAGGYPALTTTLQDYSIVLSAAENAAITDRTNLRWRIVAN